MASNFSDEEEMERDLVSPSLLDGVDDIPTQPCQKPLEGIVAFVDVRSGSKSTINTGNSLEECLEGLGANVVTRLNKDVTHIVFKAGKTNLDCVNKKEVFLVNPLWLDACKRCNERVSEAKYPVISEGVESPVILGRIKRMKSMQPKPFEEEIARSVERKRKKGKDLKEASSKKKISLAVFDFTSDEEEAIEITDQSDDSRCSSPDSLPPVSFTRTPVTSKKTLTENSEKQETPTVTESRKPLANKKPPTVDKKLTKKKDQNDVKKKDQGDKKDKMKETKVKVEGSENSFVPVKKFRRKRSSFEKQKPTLVMTSVPTKDQCAVHVVVDRLGGFELSHNVCETTTHVVCGTIRRTINILAGTVKGCWILSMDWVFKSLEAGHWLPEGPFELITEFPSAQFFRLERQMAGGLYKPSLFLKSGSIFISSDTKPSH
ncbi:PREDICTED: microcephalin-like, partial [Amphimedon queenslandica]|uniref:BRCT domain-containing protein n=1 Tax=Amphimedon queenslandica TaxID=400682 RepID=A0AAN0IJI7_AMPQE